MGLWNNLRTFVNVGFLAATDVTVTKTFGDYETAAEAQADINLLAEFMAADVTRKRFSKRVQKRALAIEDILGEPKPVEKPEKPTKEALLEWFNSLDDESKGFIKEALK